MKKTIYQRVFTIKNKLKFGINAPEHGQLIFIDPREHNRYLDFQNSFLSLKGRGNSGLVVDGDWDLQDKTGIENLFRFRACVSRWRDGLTWEETGIIDYMLKEIDKNGSVDYCFNLKDLEQRYTNLDRLFEQVQKTRSFKTQKEINPNAYNETGGVLFHIGRFNNAIWGGGGVHRFSMAKILELELIPAQLGLLHLKSLSKWNVYKDKEGVNSLK